MTLRTAFLWTLIASLSLAAVLGIIVVLVPDLISADDEILGTVLLLGLHSLPALACSIVMGRHRLRAVMWVGVGSAVGAWLIWLPFIWASPWRWRSWVDWDEVLMKLGFTLAFTSFWAAHLGLLSLLRMDRQWSQRVRNGTLTIAAALLTLGIFGLWMQIEEEWFVRLIAVLAILGGSGTVITPILALLDTMRRRSTRESIASDMRLELTCPRCGSAESLPVGPSHCESCGLRIETAVEEPRCPCGYLLFQLAGDRCPECGRQVRCGCGCFVDDPRGRCPKCGDSVTTGTG